MKPMEEEMPVRALPAPAPVPKWGQREGIGGMANSHSLAVEPPEVLERASSSALRSSKDDEEDASGSTSSYSSTGAGVAAVSLPVDLWAAEMARWSKISIYRVPEWIKRATDADAYRPMMVSLGPFHHGDPGLLPMEEHKLRAVRHVVRRSGKPLVAFISAIEEVVDELLEAYDGLDDAWRGVHRGRFVELMVTDGCFLLEFIRADQIGTEGVVDEDYAANDPIFSNRSFHYVWPVVRTDLITMENQLPLLVLQRLLAVQHGEEESTGLVNNWVMCILRCSVVERMNKLALHPLDIFHRSFCGPPRPEVEGSGKWDSVMPSAVELHEAGIHFKKSNTDYIRDVDFRNGVLLIPLITVDAHTEKIFLNLMAFEQLYRDAGNHVTDFVCFMDDLINTAEDVALLRSMGVIQQVIGSDEEVAKLFNTINKGAVMSPSSKLYLVHAKVKKHYEKRWKKWRASFVHSYLSNPWVFISLVAAAMLLLFTLLQTVYTVVPFYTRR